MGIAVSLLFVAASAVQVGVQQTPTPSGSSTSIAVQAPASARIIAGAQIRIGRDKITANISSKSQPQVRRDAAGTLWVEFS